MGDVRNPNPCNEIQLGDATLYTSHGGLTISLNWTTLDGNTLSTFRND